MEKAYPEIVVYTRPWCGSVMRVTRWLKERQIPFTEIDISQDPEAARRVEELNNGYRSVPTLLFDGKYVATEPSTADLERLLG
ncbi:MAG: glutaredoxin family protein [Anaerolineae bacterium]